MQELEDSKRFDVNLVSIVALNAEHIAQVASIATECFSGLGDYWRAFEWIECNFKAFPRMQYYVAKYSGKVIGYALWIEKGGFRERAVLELEQVGVSPHFRGNGVGRKLLRESLLAMNQYVEQRGSELKLIEVTTGVDNKAQEFYQDTLGVSQECVIKDLFRGDEAILIARP